MKSKQKIKGSVLAYALIVLSLMFSIVAALSVTTVLEKQGASSSGSSIQSFQAADSGAQWAVKQINSQLYPAQSITSTNTPVANKIGQAFTDCNDSSGTATVSKSGLNTMPISFQLTFYDKDHNLIPSCNSFYLGDIKSIKSVASFKNTVRAVEVAIVPEPTCNDGIQNGTETGVDCGGSCSACTTPTCTYTYSGWSGCQPNGTQTQTVVSSSPIGCTGTPVLSQSCVYIAPGSCQTSSLSGYNGSETYILNNGILEHDIATAPYINGYCWQCSNGTWNEINNNGGRYVGPSYNTWMDGCSF